MHIPPEFRPVDPSVRRRASEAGQAASRDAEPTASSDDGATAVADQAQLGSTFDAAAIDRFVSVLKGMNPLDLHRVEDLRQRIADGSYSTDPDELADLLLGGGRASGAADSTT